jgi:hypothetical protein
MRRKVRYWLCGLFRHRPDFFGAYCRRCGKLF